MFPSVQEKDVNAELEEKESAEEEDVNAEKPEEKESAEEEDVTVEEMREVAKEEERRAAGKLISKGETL